MATKFEQMMEGERERLSKQREDVMARKAAIDTELAEIERELNAIKLYEHAKQGKLPLPASNGTKAPRAPRKPRSEGGGKRAEVLELIKASANGLTSAEIATALNATDKAGKQSVANALSALKNDGLISQAEKRGAYTVVAA